MKFSPRTFGHTQLPLSPSKLAQTPRVEMRTVLLSILIAALSATAHADCRHPNGNIQTDAYHAPCADVLNDPRNTMCCAIERPNPSGGFIKNGFTADVCLPNGLCKQDYRNDDSTLQTQYWREECTVAGWKSGKCLSVCLSVSVRTIADICCRERSLICNRQART